MGGTPNRCPVTSDKDKVIKDSGGSKKWNFELVMSPLIMDCIAEFEQYVSFDDGLYRRVRTEIVLF